MVSLQPPTRGRAGSIDRFCATYIPSVCATFPLHANSLHLACPCLSHRWRGKCRCGRINRQQAEEDFHAEAHSHSAQDKEEDDSDEIAFSFTETNGVSREIAVAEKEDNAQPHTDGEAFTERFHIAEEEEVVSQPFARKLAEPFSQEEKRQNIACANALSDRIR